MPTSCQTGPSALEIEVIPLKLDLERAIKALPPRQRAVIGLHIAGKSCREIADMFKISPSTVAVQLDKAEGTLVAGQ